MTADSDVIDEDTLTDFYLAERERVLDIYTAIQEVARHIEGVTILGLTMGNIRIESPQAVRRRLRLLTQFNLNITASLGFGDFDENKRRNARAAEKAFLLNRIRSLEFRLAGKNPRDSRNSIYAGDFLRLNIMKSRLEELHD
ncbi:MAG: hypothetical protein AB7N80_07260 [Bdellovibrionales bacterium]